MAPADGKGHCCVCVCVQPQELVAKAKDLHPKVGHVVALGCKDGMLTAQQHLYSGHAWLLYLRPAAASWPGMGPGDSCSCRRCKPQHVLLCIAAPHGMLGVLLPPALVSALLTPILRLVCAPDLQLALGMFIFFALGATGGMMSLIMQDKPIFER